MAPLEDHQARQLAKLRHFTLATRLSQLLDIAAGRFVRANPVLLVTGFWRSGTTWMQQYLAAALNAKTVFEPLSPVNMARERMLVEKGILSSDLREAQMPGPAAADEVFWTYLDRAFYCRHLSAFELICRERVCDSLRVAVVLKDVRLQLNLLAVHARYGVPVIHMRRHPCAVVSSLLAATDWTWSFERTRLRDVLEPLTPAIRGDCALGHIDFEKFDGSTISRIAAFWAVTEALVDRSVGGREWAIIAPYEAAVASPEHYLRAICDIAHLVPVCSPSPQFESWSTHVQNRGKPLLRAHAWRDRMSEQDRAHVINIVSDIFPECEYLNNETEMPRSMRN